MIDNFDVLIVSHEKDFNKLPLVIQSIKNNIIGFDKIHIITNADFFINDERVVVHNEKNILDADFGKFKYRPNWCYQQLIKLLQNVTRDWYLVIDADTIITRMLTPIANGNAKFYINQNEQNFKPYFNFAKKLKINKIVNETFISEIMMFNRQYVKELFSLNNLKTNDEILNFMYKNITEKSQLSEYELYGNFISKYHPDEYETKKIFSWGFGRGNFDVNFWNPQRISVMIDVYGKDHDLMTFHTYN
jgi:hypothetical protein